MTSIAILQAWILSLIVSLIPPSTVPKWAATFPDTASAIAAGVTAEEPIFTGDVERARTSALIVTLLKTESDGDTYALGDHGAALGAFQIHASAYAPEAAHREAFLNDTETQVRVAVRMLRRSVQACSMREETARLAWYTSGDCGHGGAASRYRMGIMKSLLRDHPFQVAID